MAYTKNTWATDDIITADSLNNMENGIFNSQTTISAPFRDLNSVANSMVNNSGYYQIVGTLNILNGPNGTITTNGFMAIKSAGWSNAGVIDYLDIASGIHYKGSVSGGVISWSRLAKDSEVFKLTGNQTATGNKSFSGNVSIGGTPMNYSDTSTVSITGYVSGNLQVKKQSGIISFTSMDLVLTKGATFTLPAGYLPRNQLQAPITGQNASGVTAAGYLTVGSDGLVTFNSMGFASGNATAYVNVNYIAQV